MSQLPPNSLESVRKYLELVRDRMVELFWITETDAEARVVKAFRSLDLMDPDTENYLGHEEPDYWAKSIYYGPDVKWWLMSEADLRSLKPHQSED
jgi:hypothetical protein